MKFSLNQYHLYAAGAMIGTIPVVINMTNVLSHSQIIADKILNPEKSALLLIKNEIWQ
jgi:hypothetical protein